MKRPLLLFCLFFATLTLHAADVKKPNVLFIAIDDLRDWVGYLHRNEQTKTPNIDRLAKMGTAFTRSYCAAPVCNPSRAALMSGMRPSTTGVYGNEADWRKFIPEDKPLTAAFRGAGYFVSGAGKIYHGSFERRSEWDDYLDDEGGGKAEKKLSKNAKDDGVGGIKFAPLDCEDSDLPDWKITDYGIEQLGKAHEKPFFLAVGLHKPHMAWNVPQKWYDMFPLADIKLPPYKEDDLGDIPPAGVAMAKPQGDHKAMLDSGRWKEAIQAYLAATAYTDMNIGRLLDAFDKSPHKDNTIIVFWCDHGWHLGEKHHWRKFALWEEATRAPLLWVVPGLTKPGSVCERTVDFMSIYPTLMDVCGIPKPAHVEGLSIKPLLADPAAAWATPALTTHGFNNHGIRNEGWRYIRYANGEEELYNEATDPNEWTNLAKDPQYNGTKAELAKSIPAINQKPARDEEQKQKKKAEKKKKKGKTAE
ncbi:sulfatase [Prosthecobacter sp.]|uniref:sulfatase n=1 Tax=Prosthecobacter sp. TaxID=1965333 RepID=UPI002ABC2EA6|nr:sulfatase [Prosthecobacter sp.]MDZ4402917.1 sulfatase [Prosthecobacter sp.]